MKYAFLLFWGMFVASFPAQAQERDSAETADERPRYRIRSTVVGVPTTRDQFLSPLLFAGPSYGHNAANYRLFPKGLRQYNWFSTTHLLVNGSNSALLPAFNFGFDYLYHHQLLALDKPRLRLYGGGGFNSLANLKFHTGNTNNVFAHDVALTLDVSGLAAYSFDLFNRRFVLTNQLNVPVVGVLSRPSYVWSVPYFIWEEEGRFRDAVQAANWGNFLRLQNKLSLDFEMRPLFRRRSTAKPKLWRLTYAWDFYQFNGPNQVQMGHQMLQLGRNIKL